MNITPQLRQTAIRIKKPVLPSRLTFKAQRQLGTATTYRPVAKIWRWFAQQMDSLNTLLFCLVGIGAAISTVGQAFHSISVATAGLMAPVLPLLALICWPSHVTAWWAARTTAFRKLEGWRKGCYKALAYGTNGLLGYLGFDRISDNGMIFIGGAVLAPILIFRVADRKKQGSEG